MHVTSHVKTQLWPGNAAGREGGRGIRGRALPGQSEASERKRYERGRGGGPEAACLPKMLYAPVCAFLRATSPVLNLRKVDRKHDDTDHMIILRA